MSGSISKSLSFKILFATSDLRMLLVLLLVLLLLLLLLLVGGMVALVMIHSKWYPRYSKVFLSSLFLFSCVALSCVATL
jgi:hypothetical protein